jgi:hypothetical protein
MKKTTVIYHSADYDGLFCREICRLARPQAELIGWDFGQPAIKFPEEGEVIVCDLPLDAPFGSPEPYDCEKNFDRLIWIDHHKTSIEKTSEKVPGFRLVGVAACRLAWQYFLAEATWGDADYNPVVPSLEDFQKRAVSEPFAVTLAGEYDVWDHRGDGDLEFQYGLDATSPIAWYYLLQASVEDQMSYGNTLIRRGEAAMAVINKRNQDLIRSKSFPLTFGGLRFLALNTPLKGSLAFQSATTEGIDGYLAFSFDGRKWTVSMYGVEGVDVDLSRIALEHGGGGHKNACGFTCFTLPWLACEKMLADDPSIQIRKDGDKWFACRADFVNKFESPYGLGITPKLACVDLGVQMERKQIR